jgi:hypothetical protein
VWQNLPSNLRTILGSALVLGIGVTAAAFTLSFFALRSAATNPQLEFGKGHAWLFPIALDMGLVFAEVLLLGASMVKGYNRAIPILLVLAFGLGTVYFNVTRVPPEVRLITAVPPVASIFMTIGLAFLFKMLTALSGGVQAYHAPPPAYGMLGAPGSPIQGAMWRQDGGYGMPGSPIPGYQPEIPAAWPAYGQMPSPTTPANGHSGPAVDGGKGTTKRAAIDAYLSRLDTEQLQVATGPSIVEAVAAGGVQVDERDARRQLDAAKAARLPSPRKRR